MLGGNGFIGSHLVDKLLAEGHAVRVFDKYPERYRAPLKQVDYRYGDFGNRGLLAEALQGIDLVFHLINTSLPKTSNDDPAYDVQSNVIETLFMLEKCVELGVKKVVFISSGGTVYGRPTALPVSENAPTEPECSYGITKLMIEKYLALYHQLHGLDYVVVRPSNPYGSRQNPNGIQGAIPVFLGKVASGEPIEIWGDGTVVRDYLFIDDLVDGMYRAAFDKPKDRIFNLGSGAGLSLNQIVATIRSVTGVNVNVDYKPGRTFDVPAIFLDTTRAGEQLGWQPGCSLHDGVHSTWEFIKSLR
ncbi:MAG: NAD-dependent epimerase/dehydratase family protein [Geobacteraceae bacterium]|nr:NAD-dependent epimerase/dehydratase family protein [Geobacteraceae bacterium]